jgi:hypothetical protein
LNDIRLVSSGFAGVFGLILGFYVFIFAGELNENGPKAKLTFLIYGLNVGRKATAGFRVVPKNAKVIKQTVTETSFNFVLQMKPEKSSDGQGNKIRQYKFAVRRLPCAIIPKKTQFIVRALSLDLEASFSSNRFYLIFFKYQNEKVVVKILKQTNEPWSPYVDNDLETADPNITYK